MSSIYPNGSANKPSKISLAGGCYVFTGGVLTLIGWFAGIPRLTDWNGEGISMLANTAIAAASAGAALILLYFGQRWAAGVAGSITGLVGVATLLQHLTGINLGIDTLILYPQWGDIATIAPGRMGPPAATSFTIAGAAIIILVFGTRSRRVVTAAGGIITGIAMLSVIGYLFGASTLYALPRFTAIAFQTATILLALGIGVVTAVPDSQLMKMLRDDSAAALLVRRSLPFIILLPIAVGWLRLHGQYLELYDTAFGVALHTIVEVMLLAGFIWWAGKAVRAHEQPLRESEARKTAMFDAALDCVISIDHEGTISEFNPAAERTFGYRRDDVLGLELASVIIPPSHRDAHRKGMAHYLNTGEGRVLNKRIELSALRADGTEFPIELTVTRIPVNGQPQFTAYLRDITERKRLENLQVKTTDELRRLAADLSEADRHKNEFLAMLAHELRNPLAPIRNALQIIKLSGTADATLVSASGMMERQVGQLVRLVDDLLDVSRISRGKIELRKQRIELASVVHHAVEAARTLIDAMEHEFTLTLPQQPIYLRADSARLAQVIGNLLNNACKFTDKGGRISLSVATDAGEVTIRVLDNGIGIDASQMPRIFDMFIQLDDSLERSVSGLGIGLTLVKNLVELHSGTVDVSSAGAGQGTEFMVRLPADTEPVPPPHVAMSGERKPSAAGRRILVVDDNFDSAESLSILLGYDGHDVRMAHDGPEAIESAAAFRPSVIFLDIGLPLLNGYEVAQRIREEPWGKDIVIIALTGWGQEEDRQRSRESGINIHIAKPVDPPELIKRLDEIFASEGAG